MGAAKLPVINCNSERASPRVSDSYKSPSQSQAGAAAFRSCSARSLIAGLGTPDVPRGRGRRRGGLAEAPSGPGIRPAACPRARGSPGAADPPAAPQPPRGDIHSCRLPVPAQGAGAPL